MRDYHPTARQVLSELRAQYPDTPLLALGQTVWWDEPMKAVLRRMLDDLGLGGKMVLGVHDTDYFAKLPMRQPGQSHFELLAHNDGSTKSLWSAAGEISRLFGSETFPTRHDLARHRVPLARVAASLQRERGDVLNASTEAWGWRGLVYTGSSDLIVHRLPLARLGDSVEEMLRYGFQGTVESLADDCCRKEAQEMADRLIGWVRDYRAAHPEHMLTHLYQALFPRLFELLLGHEPADVELACSAHLLRLTPETAHLPRFAFIDLFLNEKTRALAAQAYNQAVVGSEIYTLDRFGLGALPFDLVLKEHGRGTLRVTLRAIHVETPTPLRIPLKRPIKGVQELAEVLTAEFGDHVTIVGKAVALISMLAREFIFVFSEEGSQYVWRTRKMNDFLRAHGVDVPVHPILRLRYSAWDALEVGHARLQLPEHLQQAFGAETIAGAEIAARWREVTAEQSRLLDELRGIASPRDLLRYLTTHDANGWPEQLAAYDAAKARLKALREKATELQAEVDGCYRSLAGVKEAIRSTEKARGDHFRATQEWDVEQTARREGFEHEIERLLAERRDLLARIARLKAERLGIERGPEAAPAREQIGAIEGRAETARLRLVRNAILTCAGLPHTAHRPSAWWLPMLDKHGHWFQRVAETTEVYTEPLIS